MKKNLLRLAMLLAAVTVSFAFASCSDDDDDVSSSSSIQSKIVGTWAADKVTSPGVGQYTFVFNKNGTGTEHCWCYDDYSNVVDIGTESFTYEIDDNSTWDKEDYTLWLTWSTSDDLVSKYEGYWLFPYDFLGYELSIYNNGNSMDIARNSFKRVTTE